MYQSLISASSNCVYLRDVVALEVVVEVVVVLEVVEEVVALGVVEEAEGGVVDAFK